MTVVFTLIPSAWETVWNIIGTQLTIFKWMNFKFF